MNAEKVIFGFFVLLALTLNFGFFWGDIDNPDHHNAWELFAAIVVSLVATIMKLGERTQIGGVLLASSLVADLQLLAAAAVWAVAAHATDAGMTPAVMASVVSLSGGALLANLVSAAVVLIETSRFRR